MKLRPELEDENTRYYSGGAPPQPFRVLLPSSDSLPIVRTERLCLRPLTLGDIDTIFNIRPKEANSWYTPWTSVDEARAWFDRKTFCEPASAAGLTFQYGIILGPDPSGEMIGTIGMNQVHPRPNIGYGLTDAHTGKGYMSEALGGVLGVWWGLPRREGESDEEEQSEDWDGTERVFATASKANRASVKVLEKNGFEVYFERTTGSGDTVCCAAVTAQLPDD
ncbi:predicted protein [Uncinocarpus reesii 1704]|uniref:N-acetyltransferase domain-containing protein n=1 Tax=Uncinocarpus reesii (strain UAMH 1704) TaxID=336963 RepID=C4JDT6_UNCRE|nr:uncharacterized protein UREG_00563 [Uncinocarpus reesii 1704]EEP75716.1 predicted protein [Uncinocarpus reesii 1704]